MSEVKSLKEYQERNYCGQVTYEDLERKSYEQMKKIDALGAEIDEVRRVADAALEKQFVAGMDYASKVWIDDISCLKRQLAQAKSACMILADEIIQHNGTFDFYSGPHVIVDIALNQAKEQEAERDTEQA